MAAGGNRSNNSAFLGCRSKIANLGVTALKFTITVITTADYYYQRNQKNYFVSFNKLEHIDFLFREIIADRAMLEAVQAKP